MKLFYFLLSSFLFLTISSAQTTSIPDANFEQALIDLGYDTGVPDGSVPTANISTVTSLDVSSNSIADLTGIEDFSALTVLVCHDNALSSINLNSNTALTFLDCSNNQISSLDVSQNAALIELYCSDNNMTSLNVSQNPALTHLMCRHNQLTALNIGQSSALTMLWAASNNLTSLDLSQNNNLSMVTCDQNQLTSLNVTGCNVLDQLQCGGNSLSSIDLSTCTALRYFSCDANNLTSLDVSQNTNLEELSCGNNLLTSLDVSQNSKLFNLEFSDNQISSIDVSQNDTLRVFSAYGNQLTELDLSWNPVLYRVFVGSNQLTCLNVRNGNNVNFTAFDATMNPNLNCIEVDDSTYSANNWTNIDNQSYFQRICANACTSTASLEEKESVSLSCYPNPTQGKVSIDLNKNSAVQVKLRNSLGQEVLFQEFKSAKMIVLNIEGPKGLYFLEIMLSSGLTKSMKIIKE